MSFPLFVLLSAAIAAAVSAACLLTQPRWLAVIAVFAGATVVLLMHGPLYFDYYSDDAFITLRYSRHLADGLGPNWNSAGRVEGYTNFLWMAVLAGFAKLGFDLVATSEVLGFLSLLATLFFVYRIWNLWADELPGSGLASPLVLAAALLGLALVDGVAFWGFSGMETPLFAALVTGSSYFYFIERRGGRVPWSAVLLAAAAMTRPEGLLVAAITGVFYLTHAFTSDDRRATLLRIAGWAGVFLLLYGPYFAWRYAYYDYLLPNTYYAKVGLTTASLDRGLQYLADPGLQYQLLALLVGVAVLTAVERLRPDALYIGVVAIGLLAGIVYEGGGDVHGRFLVPVMPLLFLGGLAGFADLLGRARLPQVHVALVASLALGLGALSLLPSSRDPLLPFGPTGRAESRILGTWLNERTPPDYTIADFAIGAISYYASDRNFLDLLGLNDVVIAHTGIPNMGEGVLGHEKYNVNYVLDEARPEIILLRHQIHSRPRTAEELLPLVRTPLVKASDVLFTDLRLWSRYQVRAVNLEGRWYHFLQRRDTVGELQASNLR